ncbi:MAG: HlyD family type I secretion periplasmic adaptor subunit [Alphaproteobacteria bacterium]|nr:MAG: HlyD family type I secretion periplasmic adaptor subunit [Alphaproteobacteria bacterium]
MSTRAFILAGCLIALFGFGGFVAWAATAEVASAVIAPGIVSVESARKSIAHLEGGIVQKVHVRDGDRVKAGDVLVSLSPVQSAASLDMLIGQRNTLLATRARLDAEVKGGEPEFPPHVHPAVIADQTALYRTRRQFLAQQVGVLDARIDSGLQQIEGLTHRADSLRSAAASLREQLKGATDLASKGLKAQNEVREIERTALTIEGDVGETTAQIAAAEASVAEAEMQRVVLRYQFRQDAAAELAKVNDELATLDEKIRVAEDAQNRTEITAPQDGIIQSLLVHGAGAVIQPGQAFAELVPVADDLVVSADVPSGDIDQLYPGMETEVRFPSFSASTTPIIRGHVVAMSGDALPDAEGRRLTHRVEIQVDTDSIPADLRDRLMPGMPAMVLATTQQRTVMSYLLRPIKDAVATSLRER